MSGCVSRTDPPRLIDTGERRCLALTMYWEARGEGERGMIAVGAVVLNRTAHHAFPGSVCAVVTQGGETPPCQFEWWCDGRSNIPREPASWRASLETADYMLRARLGDPTHGALFFHATRIRPDWSRRLERTTKIGNHVFYR